MSPSAEASGAAIVRIEIDVRVIADKEWDIVAWLWQAFRNDLSQAVGGFPYRDGRYQRATLDVYPASDHIGYLAWSPHPNTGEDAPVGFALVGATGDRLALEALWVVPAARRSGVGMRFALDVLRRHPGPWEVAFQHDNAPAGRFWRAVARRALGDAWDETTGAVPHKPDAPPDHWIRSK